MLHWLFYHIIEKRITLDKKIELFPFANFAATTPFSQSNEIKNVIFILQTMLNMCVFNIFWFSFPLEILVSVRMLKCNNKAALSLLTRSHLVIFRAVFAPTGMCAPSPNTSRTTKLSYKTKQQFIRSMHCKFWIKKVFFKNIIIVLVL